MNSNDSAATRGGERERERERGREGRKGRGGGTADKRRRKERKSQIHPKNTAVHFRSLLMC